MDVISDGMTRVFWVPAIVTITAPTVAELNAGINATDRLTSDGLIGWAAGTASVPNSSLASKTDTTRAGRDSYSGPRWRVKEIDTADNLKSTLVKGVFGFVAIRRNLAESTAWASTQKLQVYPVEVGRRVDMEHEDNSMSRYEIPFYVHIPPAHDAVVA